MMHGWASLVWIGINRVFHIHYDDLTILPTIMLNIAYAIYRKCDISHMHFVNVAYRIGDIQHMQYLTLHNAYAIYSIRDTFSRTLSLCLVSGYSECTISNTYAFLICTSEVSFLFHEWHQKVEPTSYDRPQAIFYYQFHLIKLTFYNFNLTYFKACRPRYFKKQA